MTSTAAGQVPHPLAVAQRRSVAGIPALRAISVAQGGVVLIDGLGPVRWDDSSLRDDDGVIVFKPDAIAASDPGRWVATAGFVFSGAAECSVGAGGDFATINDALAFASLLRASADTGSAVLTIRLLSGFVMAEQVWVFGHDFSWVRIESVDAEVTIDRASLTEGWPTSPTRFPAWGFSDGAIGPTFDVLFSMNATGASDGRNGIWVRDGAYCKILNGAGVKHAERGLHVTNGSVDASGGIFTDNVIGVRVANNGLARIDNADVSGCSSSGLAVGGGTVEGVALVAKNCQVGVFSSGGNLRLSGADVSNNVGIGLDLNSAYLFGRDMVISNNGADGLRLSNGGFALLRDAELDGNGRGIVATHGAVVVGGGTVKNSVGDNVRATFQSLVRVDAVTGAGGINISADSGAVVGAGAVSGGNQNIVATGGARVNVTGGAAIDGAAASPAVDVSGGAVVDAGGSSVTDPGQPINVWTDAGVIRSAASHVARRACQETAIFDTSRYLLLVPVGLGPVVCTGAIHGNRRVGASSAQEAGLIQLTVRVSQAGHIAAVLTVARSTGAVPLVRKVTLGAVDYVALDLGGAEAGWMDDARFIGTVDYSAGARAEAEAFMTTVGSVDTDAAVDSGTVIALT